MTVCTRRRSCGFVFGQGFNSPRLHQMDIGRTSIISKAVSPLKFDSDVKTEKEGQGYKNLGSLFVVLGILAVFLLLQPFLECRLAFLNVVILSDFRSQMSCKGISRTNTSSTAAQRINLRCFLLCRLFLAIYFLQSSLPEAALGVGWDVGNRQI